MKTESDTSISTSSWQGMIALMAAIGASVCCVAPLVLLSLGIGGAWVSTLTAMEPVRPFFYPVEPAFYRTRISTNLYHT